VRLAGHTRQRVQCFSSRVQYRRYSPGSFADWRSIACVHPRTLRLSRRSLMSWLTSTQGPGYRSDSENFGYAAAGEMPCLHPPSEAGRPLSWHSAALTCAVTRSNAALEIPHKRSRRTQECAAVAQHLRPPAASKRGLIGDIFGHLNSRRRSLGSARTEISEVVPKRFGLRLDPLLPRP
jgi:hypothetical protein